MIYIIIDHEEGYTPCVVFASLNEEKARAEYERLKVNNRNKNRRYILEETEVS